MMPQVRLAMTSLSGDRCFASLNTVQAFRLMGLQARRLEVCCGQLRQGAAEVKVLTGGNV